MNVILIVLKAVPANKVFVINPFAMSFTQSVELLVREFYLKFLIPFIVIRRGKMKRLEMEVIFLAHSDCCLFLGKCTRIIITKLIYTRLAWICSVLWIRIPLLRKHEWSETMTANETLELACETGNIELLKQAIAEGCDVNYVNNQWDETCFEKMIWYWGCGGGNEADNDYEPDWPQWSEEHMIEFVGIMIDAGLDLNRISHDGLESFNLFWSVAKWGQSLPLLEYMLQRGMNPNYMDGDCSMLDALDGDIFAEECCGKPNYAAELYNACRLAVAYGALPSILLGKQYEEGEEDYYEAAMRLDGEYFIAKAKDNPGKDLKADKMLVYYGRYGYPKEFYYETEKFQKRLIAALDKIVDVIGIENLDNHVLNECVEQQYDLVLEHLLIRGANPNVNCFTSYYNYVKSSALWTAEKDGEYYAEGIAEKMKAALYAAGAIHSPICF